MRVLLRDEGVPVIRTSRSYTGVPLAAAWTAAEGNRQIERARAAQPALSAREVEVVELIAKGLRNKEIATNLHLTEETIKVHIRRIFFKLNVTDRTAAVRIALTRGMIHLN